MEARDVIGGISAALCVGAVRADVVAVEARRAAFERNTGWAQPDCHPGAKVDVLEHRVVSLTQRRLADPAAVIAGLPPDKRPLPSVAGYDDLLKLCAQPSSAPPSKEQVS
jgi:hypothetical protein